MSFKSFIRLCKPITRISCLSLAIVSYQHREIIINQNHYRTKCDEVVKEILNKDTNIIKNNNGDNNNNNNNDNNNDDVDDDDEAWEAEKQNCSFCRQFLQSPCKLPFKNWSKCVDKAKVDNTDFVTVCSQYTSSLMQCTSENAQYFEQAFAQQKRDEGDDIEEEEISSTSENQNNNNKIDSEIDSE